jgi:hypothetical protein
MIRLVQGSPALTFRSGGLSTGFSATADYWREQPYHPPNQITPVTRRSRTLAQSAHRSPGRIVGLSDLWVAARGEVS